MPDIPPVVAPFGATALGKSDVALALARELDAEIVVADSMQIYAGLAIVTNQPDAEARAQAAYHLVGWASPQEDHTVAEYAGRAHAVVDRLVRDHRRVVVEGGSGLYLRAALGDLAFGGAPTEGRRRALEERWARDPEGMVAELRVRAPDVATRVDVGNGRRLIRALEALEEVAAAQHAGRNVFAETCPQYLYLTLEDQLAQPGFEGAKWVCSTPLRTKHEHHQADLWKGLRMNELAVVSTDHCPFCFKDQKELGLGDFSKIPNGIGGIEHRMELIYQGVVLGEISLERWVETCCTTPARTQSVSVSAATSRSDQKSTRGTTALKALMTTCQSWGMLRPVPDC